MSNAVVEHLQAFPDRNDAAPMSLGSSREIDLREILRKVRRRRGIFIATVLFLMGATLAILAVLPPRYTGQTLVMIEAREAKFADFDAVLSGLAGDSETVQSEIEVVASRQLADTVVGQFGLIADPEFNSALREPGLGGRIVSAIWSAVLEPIAEWLQGITGDRRDGSGAGVDEAARTRVAVVDEFLDRLKVYPKGLSRVIAIEFSAHDPEQAATLANALASAYIEQQVVRKLDATQRATDWLDTRIAALRERVRASEQAVEDYRKKTGLFEGADRSLSRSLNLSAQQVSELTSQLILARSDRAQAEARLQQLKTQMARGDVESASEVLSSTLIQRLREQEAELRRKAAELSVDYGPKHPKMLNVQAEIRDLGAKISAEVQKIARGLQNAVGVARAREAELERSLKAHEARLGAANVNEVQLRALMREATANRTLLESFLTRFKETSAQADLSSQQPDARVISPASVPVDPSFPRPALVLVIALGFSLAVAFMLVLLIEHLDEGVKTGDEIERVTGVPVLGLVPEVRGVLRRRRGPERMVIDKPASGLGESIRSLQASIVLSDLDSPPKRILITSAQLGEGKTTVAVCLARVLALAGKRVVLVDADLRHPRVHRAVRIADKYGLTELLRNEVPLEAVLQRDRETGCCVIPAGGITENPAEALSSDRMRSLLDGLARTYDFVILDSPPVLAVSDSRILSREVDETVFVVRWNGTPRDLAAAGVRQLLTSGGRLLGILLTMVDVKRHALYGYGDSGYYYAAASRYSAG